MSMRKDIYTTRFPIIIDNGIILKSMKLTSFTISYMVNIDFGYNEFSLSLWNDAAKYSYLAEQDGLCSKPQYKDLPINVEYIFFFPKENKYKGVGNTLKYYCNWS